MTDKKTQDELDHILTIRIAGSMVLDRTSRESIKEDLAEWRNQQVLQALAEVKSKNTLFKGYTYDKRGVLHTETLAEGIPVSAVEEVERKYK